MASTIAGTAFTSSQLPKADGGNIQLSNDRLATPLPEHGKSEPVPFNLTLEEDKRNPGQFQLVVNVDPQRATSKGSHQKRAVASTQLYANLQNVPSLGYDVSSLYQTRKSSPPSSPQEEKGWSDLDAIPSGFLNKVVPDWEVSFLQRKESTASTQSKKLADIRARIKKSGKGFVVRLLKGSSGNDDEVAEVKLGQDDLSKEATAQELDTGQHVELDGTSIPVFEIGSSNEPGLERPASVLSPVDMCPTPRWRRQQSKFPTNPRQSISDEGLSDAETLIQDVRSIAETLDDVPTDLEPLSTISSTLPTRATSIVKTPTRGLSVVGPVIRINKSDRHRRLGSRGQILRGDLNRSDARKSIKRRSPHSSMSASTRNSSSFTVKDSRNPSEQVPQQTLQTYTDPMGNLLNSSSVQQSSVQTAATAGSSGNNGLRHRLRVETNVKRSKITNASPVTKRRPHHRKISQRSTSFPSDQSPVEPRRKASPAWSEVDASEELREALEHAFGSVEDDLSPIYTRETRSLPEPEGAPLDGGRGDIPLPADVEIRSAPPAISNPTSTFWNLAASALGEQLLNGLQFLRERYGAESPVPANHVRVRWVCSCGESLYDDFIEQRPGAARLLEAYLNRPRAHAPGSPTGRSSTASSMASVFSSASKASTLATPSSTYGGSASWGKSDASSYSPTRLRGSNPFSVRIGSFMEEQWLLTCANEGRFTPKIVHLDVNAGKIRSDKDLALSLRDHYQQLSQRWYKWFKLRGLTTIEYVQFEIHRNRFADIRATPAMPPTSSACVAPVASPPPLHNESKTPSEHPYSFEPVDLLPPVGSMYLLHLFKHPSDYDGELITYLRSPKRRERLETGMGWGINLVEGFLAQKIWICIMLGFVLGSAVFAITWSALKHDVQGAFGVAGWVIAIAGMALGGLQGLLD